MNMIMKFITKNYYNLMDLITPFVLTMTSVPLVVYLCRFIPVFIHSFVHPKLLVFFSNEHQNTVLNTEHSFPQ